MKLALRSHTLQGKYLDRLFVTATRQGKLATMAIYFEEADITAHIMLTRGRS